MMAAGVIYQCHLILLMGGCNTFCGFNKRIYIFKVTVTHLLLLDIAVLSFSQCARPAIAAIPF
jgi:hypothetical protein